MSLKLSLIALAFSSMIFTDKDIVHDIVGPHQASAEELNQKPANTVNSSEVSEQISLEESSEQPANSDQATSISFVSPNLIVDEVKDSDDRTTKAEIRKSKTPLEALVAYQKILDKN